MSQDDEIFQELISKQENSYEKIKLINTNYKKDSVSRKTIEYLNIRINALEAHWDEFQANNDILKRFESSQSDHDYFKKRVFMITQTIYNETKQSMTNLRIYLTSEAGPSGTAEPRKREAHTNLTHDELQQFTVEDTDITVSKMLRNQLCNFNALERAVSKVRLDENQEKWQLQDQLKTLQSKWESIDKIHWELSYLLEGRNKPYDEKFDYWEKSFDELKEKINKKIWENSHYETSTPKIELPEFNGSYNNWISFRDLFFEMIHNNPTLNKTQKMKYLKSKLKGEAEKLIKHLPVSADNYDSCLDIIEHRYDNKRLLFTSYIETLLNQPPIDKQNSTTLKRLHDTTKECLNALENIHIDIPVWGPLIVHLLLSKIDDDTYSDYIQSLQNSRELPDLNEFMDFLEHKFMSLETARNKKSGLKQNYSTNISANNNQHKNNYGTKSMNFNKAEKWPKTYFTTLRNCPLCKNEHALMQCASFLTMDVATRNQTACNLKLCKNCLFSHGGNKCISTKQCRTCHFKHHSLLHDDNFKGQQSKPFSATMITTERTSNHVNNNNQEILLTTLQLKVKNREGNYVILRALLDQGSQVTLITENAAQLLNLPRNKLTAAVTGVGTVMGTSKGMIKLQCKSIHSNYTFETEALVMRRLINNLPNSTIRTDNWPHLENIKLADPQFNISGPIDLLLGADIYSEIILDGVLKQDPNLPVAQQTKLGWILCGATKQLNCLVTLMELDNISNFWEIEEIPTETKSTETDEYCQRYYAETTERLDNGRYVVKMPMKDDYEKNLGNSKPQAIAQFLQLEKKMARQKHFAKLYKQFINEYIELEHMKPVTSSNYKLHSYLPHHGVIKESSTTTKLRSVFNASMKTDSGYSLNDLMEKGPNLQKDILSLITKWRSYKYVITADIEKMYRQILIHQDQQHLQTIIWRESAKQHLKEMQLCTLTYGTKVAPFLAIRTLQQLATDEGSAYPLALKALQHDFYMDDVITGHQTIESTALLRKELYELLKKGGFILRKWATNEPTIIEELHDQDKSQSDFNFKQQEFSKTLGLVWNDTTDTFHFKTETADNVENNIYTKRRLLSEISKIYDPLGWLAPITIQAKLIFQKLWSETFNQISWDDKLPEDITKQWITIKSELTQINNVSLPRWMKNNNKTIELQAFCDASEQAYACVIYSRTTNPNGEYVMTLIAAKTKVAPLKNKLSVPKLELCGATLLAKLLEKVTKALTDYDLKISCWTDSKVVLAWLQGKQTKWEKYITNRTSKITEIVPASNWGYVKSNENPADCATRGLSPAKLINFALWWEGPSYLKNQKTVETISETFSTNEGSIKLCLTTNPTINKNEFIHSLLERYSNMDRITRILAWVLRFINILRHKGSTNCNELSLTEMNKATSAIIKSIQDNYFEKEIACLKENGKLLNKSPILKLSPFLDDGILRVGGRLKHSDLPMETKHPILIPNEGRITLLIIEDAHRKTLHGGARLTLAYIRNTYWIIGGNRAVKRTLRRCIRCHRYTTIKNEQLMGNLPKERVTPSRPFSHTGVDFTGHVEVKINKGRGIKTCKGYIAIFICMSTKAVHIELVSDLSSQTFIAALKRMCARRGTPSHIYSDNGTNFVGAAKLLNEEFEQYKTFLSSEFFKEVNNLQIKWHFNAPVWPSAGGLWEAAVRSMKKHLKRVIGEQKLTYEQFSTLLTQIEACMNSRPLSSLSEDVDDMDYLTPGHFLTGGSLLSLPLHEPEEMKSIDIRNNWKLIELMRRHYWDRWSHEYLHSLQNRNKWQQTKGNIQKGQLVLVKESNLPPGKWAMGRVVELHPGSDQLVRVVTLKTQNGVLKRPITKLAPLPLNEVCQTTVPPKTDPENKNKTTYQTNKTVNSLLMLLLVAFTTLTPGLATPVQNYKLTQLSEAHPIYFDSVGNIQLIHDEWKLVVYYNLTTFWESTLKIETFVNHLTQICTTMPNEQCHGTMTQLKFEIMQLKYYNELLLSQHKQRRRRGYVNGVGNLARTLFGVLDSNFAQKYENDIHKVKNNEQHLLELIKNQTLIIEAENNIIKQNEEFVKSQFVTIQRYMQETKDDFEVIENRARVMKTMNDVNAGALTASLLLSALRRNQEMLLNALTDIYRGHLDMNLFTPKQLTEQLQIIAGAMSKRLTLPVKNKNDIREIYKLIYVKARLTKQYLLFELHIPLLSDDEYILYNTIPIPKQLSQDQCQVITITSKYIGVNFAKNTYIQVEEKDIQQCTTAMADNYICHAYMPVLSLHGPTASCEAQLLSQNTNVRCEWLQQKCNDQWIKLHKPNIWLYSCRTECPTRIVCEDQITTITMTKAGLVALGQGCIIRFKDSTLYSYNVFGSKTEIGVTLEVPTLDSPNDMLESSKHTHLMVLPTQDLSKEHEKIDRQIIVQKEGEHFTSDLSTHYIVNYSISSLVVGGIIIVLWRFKKQLSWGCCKNNNRPTATSINPVNTENEQQITETSRRVEQQFELQDIAGYARVEYGRSQTGTLPKTANRTRFNI